MATRVCPLNSSRLTQIVAAAGAIAACALGADAGIATSGFTYSDFSSADGLFLVGSATQAGSAIRMADITGGRSAGAMWRIDKQDVASGFTTTFTYTIPEMTGLGADGFAFVIQNTSVAALGGNGGGLGYANNPMFGGTGIRNSLAVEFDLWDNKVHGDWNDLDHNHVSIQTAGMDPNDADHAFSLGAASFADDGQEGILHTARITYVPGVMTVWVDDMTKPALTVAGVDLNDILQLDKGGYAWVGITGAIGGSNDLQTEVVNSWGFSNNVIPAPGAMALLGLSGLILTQRRR